MEMKKILVAGESWTSFTTHVKGFDTFVTSVYEEGIEFLANLSISQDSMLRNAFPVQQRNFLNTHALCSPISARIHCCFRMILLSAVSKLRTAASRLRNMFKGAAPSSW